VKHRLLVEGCTSQPVAQCGQLNTDGEAEISSARADQNRMIADRRPFLYRVYGNVGAREC
jgi:hypothetical protein